MAEPRHLPARPHLVPRPEHPPKVGLRISVEMAARMRIGRSRIFNLRPVDVSELIRIAEAMERRQA
jgi:hypothetical protein